MMSSVGQYSRWVYKIDKSFKFKRAFKYNITTVRNEDERCKLVWWKDIKQLKLLIWENPNKRNKAQHPHYLFENWGAVFHPSCSMCRRLAQGETGCTPWWHSDQVPLSECSLSANAERLCQSDPLIVRWCLMGEKAVLGGVRTWFTISTILQEVNIIKKLMDLLNFVEMLRTISLMIRNKKECQKVVNEWHYFY